ncbi:MAG: hypothetical protein IPK82_34935 [Polyangiaceae bacterium]|nr:hypothetical protein [Polyangiaceae bacterium]
MKLEDRVRDGEGLLQDFELAAEERFLDAQALLARGHGTGAAYVVGYVAEMLLKSAVFLFDGARPSDLVYPRLSPAKKWAQKAMPGVPFTNFHDILFWAWVLRKKRAERGRALPEPEAQNLMRIAHRLNRGWSVELRYFGFEVTIEHARRCFEDVAWIKKHHPLLWR